MTIGAIIDHKTSLAAYAAAGFSFPVIPAGKNTILHHFDDTDGNHCLIINQRGHAPRASDNEKEIA